MLLIICSQMNSAVRIGTISENIWRTKTQPRYKINCETFEMVRHNPLCINVFDQYLKNILSYLILMVRHTHSWKAQAQAATTEGM